MSRVFKTKEAAQYLGAHVETVRRLARRGEIPAFKIGKDWRFGENALKKWAETHYLRYRRFHVLIVDDEETVLEHIKQMLVPEGYKISMVSNGSQALELIQRDLPDVVILDLKIPELNGSSTLKEIRRLEENLPVIVITDYPESDLMMEALKNSPIMVLLKTLEYKRMIEAVNLALNWAR